MYWSLFQLECLAVLVHQMLLRGRNPISPQPTGGRGPGGKVWHLETSQGPPRPVEPMSLFWQIIVQFIYYLTKTFTGTIWSHCKDWDWTKHFIYSYVFYTWRCCLYLKHLSNHWFHWCWDTSIHLYATWEKCNSFREMSQVSHINTLLLFFLK